MLFRVSTITGIFVVISLLLLPNGAFAQEEPLETAEKLLRWQIESLKDGDYKRFIKHCNKAFREMADKWWFDNLKMSKGGKIAKGYAIEYLGSIRRVGMREHLWKVSITGDKYEILASLTLADRKVVAFDLN